MLKKRILWKYFEKYQLSENLRLQTKNYKFKNWLLNIGKHQNVSKFESENNVIEIPSELICNADLITGINGNEINGNDPSLEEKIIILSLNVDILKLNEDIMHRMLGEEKIFYNEDNVENDYNDTLENSIPIEFLNSQNP